MTQILSSGCCGHMGRVITHCVKQKDNCEITAGVDLSGEQYDAFPVYQSFRDVKEQADVIIDFSHPNALENLLEFAVERSLPVVIATTGYNEKHIEKINAASKSIPIFFTYNMSIGINLLAELAQKAAAVLSDDFDIEIIEKHHNQKIDAPSGTAIMLADAINSSLNNKYHYEYDRHAKRAKRDQNEIGMHSIRGGTIVGEHEIMFAGRDEIITLSHSARSKEVFATGAVNAALFLKGKDSGIYTMADLVASK